jgi:fructokinase
MVPAEFDAAVKALHLGTLGFVLEPMADTLVEIVEREHGKRLLMVDPNVRPGLEPDAEYRERLQHVIGKSTLVKASDADLAWLYPGLEYAHAAERIVEKGVRAVVVTLGPDGAFGAHRDIRLRVPAPRVQVVDTIGAGDAFGAALLAWLNDHECLVPDLHLNGTELRAALEYACLAAAITCTRAGADPPHKWEMVAV